MVRSDATADDSLAAIRARIRFGMAIAAMIRMMATTISNSMSENPFCFPISVIFPKIICPDIRLSDYQLTSDKALTLPNCRTGLYHRSRLLSAEGALLRSGGRFFRRGMADNWEASD